MKILKIVVSKGRTVNLGNYESARVDITMEAEIEDHDNYTVCFNSLSEMVQKLLDNEVGEIK